MTGTDPLHQALRGATAPPPPRSAVTVHEAIVWGAGGPLGSALLERALGAGVFRRVHAATQRPVAPALRGFVPWPVDAPTAGAGASARTAFVVLDRPRASNGRDDAFAPAAPDDLPRIAARLHAAGVHQLLVLMPHTAAMLPQALRTGLASLDEASVASLGFEQLVMVRTARAPESVTGLNPPQRLAAWMLSQMRFMTPQRLSPVRPARVAALAVEIARVLPQAPPASRVVPPEAVWLAAQHASPDALVQAWLAGTPWPEVAAARPRL